MAEKFYHPQPCFCLPCKVIKANNLKPPTKEELSGPALEKPAKKSKRKK